MLSQTKRWRYKWYGYLHIDGSLHVKRFSGDLGDIIECRQSPFVDFVFKPFYADNRNHALSILKQKIFQKDTSG